MTDDLLPAPGGESGRSRPPLPPHIGKYRVTGRIGKGAMGVVYSGFDDAERRDVAIKVLMADFQDDPTTRTRFYREAQTSGSLVHRNIIAVYDVGEDDGRTYLVMELLRGKTLSEFIRRAEGVSLEQKLDVMMQMCDGLHCAHVQGVFHRDIKPGNIFVLNDGTLKILDFGVARLATSTLTGSGAIIGTPDYMAPEQARGREVDQRSDVFSSAGVFYFMLSGRKPFTGSSLPVTLRNVQFENPTPLTPEEAPQALAAIIDKGLAKDPAKRYQSMMEMFADLARFRRAYEAETRQMAGALIRRLRSTEALAGIWRNLAESIGQSVDKSEPVAVSKLKEEYPAFVEQSDSSVLIVPFTRAALQQVSAEIDAEQARLQHVVEKLRAECEKRAGH